jgi:hypothetical protein
MKKAFYKVFFLLLPVILLFTLPAYILIETGELSSIQKIIELQSSSKNLVQFGLAYSNSDPYYKLNSVKFRNPEITVLGSSTSMQIRSRFFKEGVRFFNAGRAVSHVDHYRYFVDRISRGKEPKIIIIVMDPNYFNPYWQSLNENTDDKFINRVNGIEILLNNWGKIYTDLFSSKLSIQKIYADRENYKNKNYFGISAIMKGTGFRNDGSYNYGDINSQNPDFIDYQFKATLQSIKIGSGRLKYSKDVSLLAINELDRFLKECKERNIHIIGYLTPFAHIVFEQIYALKDDKYKYIFELDNYLKPLLEKYNYEYFNFTDLASIGASDNETIDGEHGSEKATLRLFIKMAEKSEVLAKYCDCDFLKSKLSSAKGDINVFYDEF